MNIVHESVILNNQDKRVKRGQIGLTNAKRCNFLQTKSTEVIRSNRKFNTMSTAVTEAIQIDKLCQEIMTCISESSLNYSVNLTPYSLYITVRKSFSKKKTSI